MTVIDDTFSVSQEKKHNLQDVDEQKSNRSTFSGTLKLGCAQRQTSVNQKEKNNDDKQECNQDEEEIQNQEEVLDLSSLRNKNPTDLLRQAQELGLYNLSGMSTPDLVVNITKKLVATNNQIKVVDTGVAEVLNEGFAFMRSCASNYLASQDDVYISPGQVKRLSIRTGDLVTGDVRPPRREERYFSLSRATKINDVPVTGARHYVNFESLVPFYPNCTIDLECSKPKKTPDGKDDLSGRIINIVAPLGRGQRALIVAQPKAGKTMLLQTIAHSISVNYPDIHLIMLLVDERPEEVTDMRRSVQAEVVSSTFDEPADKHVHVAEFVTEKSKRLVEQGKHVVVLLDSITRLARAYNSVIPSSGKLLSGGVDSNALQKVKRLFGAARNIEGGGSLTMIGTTLVDTGSRMDDLIYEEFKGTGNSEIILDRKLAEKRIFPAIDISKSGTRKEELLFDSPTLQKIYMLRRILNPMTDAEAMDFLVDKLQRTKSNKDFFLMMDRKGN